MKKNTLFIVFALVCFGYLQNAHAQEYDPSVSKELFVAGVPTAIPYDIVRVGESYATVFEYIDATTLYSLLLEDQNNYDLCLLCILFLSNS